MQLINIGFGNIVSANRIIAIISPESAPIKRIVQEAKDEGMAIDATYGRRTRAVIIMDSGHVLLSAVQPETVAGRLDRDDVATTIDEIIKTRRQQIYFSNSYCKKSKTNCSRKQTINFKGGAITCILRCWRVRRR